MVGHPRSAKDILAHYQGLTAAGDGPGASQLGQYLTTTDAAAAGLKVSPSYRPLSAQHEDIVREIGADAPEVALDLAGTEAKDWADHVARMRVMLWLLRDTELLNEADGLNVTGEPGEVMGGIRAWFRKVYAKYGIRQNL